MPRKLVFRARRHGETEWKEVAAANTAHHELINRFRREILEVKTNEEYAEAELAWLTVQHSRGNILTTAAAKKAVRSEADRIAKEEEAFEVAKIQKRNKVLKEKPSVFSPQELEAMKIERAAIDAHNAKHGIAPASALNAPPVQTAAEKKAAALAKAREVKTAKAKPEESSEQQELEATAQSPETP